MNILGASVPVEMLAAQTATSTATGTGQDIQVYDKSAKFILSSTAGTGTTPTLDVVVEHSDVVGSGYAAAAGGTFTQVTDAAASFQTLDVDIRGLKKFIRVVATIAGTTPSFTFSVVGIFTQQ